MKEHNKLSEEEVVKLKNTLLQLNGALLRLGINKEDAHIVLPKVDWIYFNNVLSSDKVVFLITISKLMIMNLPLAVL